MKEGFEEHEKFVDEINLCLFENWAEKEFIRRLKSGNADDLKFELTPPEYF